MGELLDNFTKSFSSVLNLGQDSQRRVQDDSNPFPFPFLNFGQASQLKVDDDQYKYKLKGEKFGSCQDAKQLQALLQEPDAKQFQACQDDKQLQVLLQERLEMAAKPESPKTRQQDFQGDVRILKEALRQLVERQISAPVEATKLAKDHKSMAAMKGKEIRKICEERATKLPSTMQPKHTESKEMQARTLDLESLEKEREREKHEHDARMHAEKLKRRVEADQLTKTGKANEDSGDFHGAVAAYDRALRILLYGTLPSPR